MKKIIFYLLIFNLTSVIAVETNSTENEKKLSKKEYKKQIEVLIKKEEKYSKMLKSEATLREKLARIESNYKHADNNFQKVKEIRLLVDDMRQNEDCYIKYYRIQDLNIQIKNENNEKNRNKFLKIKNKINETFIQKCKNIKTNLLKKYQK
jgi:hypothetical protein